ncbi:MAG: excinuclease ABC subunit UvrC [Phycisphaerae bacterium]
MDDVNRESFITNLRKKISDLPKAPGVYLFKDAQGRVVYVGKSVDLRSRVASYFQPSADLESARGPRIFEMIKQVATVDYIECENEVQALLDENRLIKDIQPPYNERLMDDKSYPYLEITIQDEYPLVFITREPNPKSKLFGPFIDSGGLRAAYREMQKIFKFCTCGRPLNREDIAKNRERPCLLYSIGLCSGACAGKISNEAYREDIKRLIKFLAGGRRAVLKEMRTQLKKVVKELRYEQAAKFRDQIKALESLSLAGKPDVDLQPEVFFQDPKEGLEKLTKLLGMEHPPRIIEGFDIANLQGGEACGSMVQFIDGMVFKSGYKRFKIKYAANRSDDYDMIREVIARRYRHVAVGEELLPDLILIDGGPGQRRAVMDAFATLPIQPPKIISLAKKEEEIYTGSPNDPIKLPRNNPALKLLQRIRDEAHRFAQHYHHILRRKKVLEED